MNSIMYGCYDPYHISKHIYKCDGCQKIVKPKKGYKTRYGSPGCIFVCPKCSHLTFAYRYHRAIFHSEEASVSGAAW